MNYQIDQSGKKEPKNPLFADFLTSKRTDVMILAPSSNTITNNWQFVNSQNGVDPRGVEPLLLALTEQVPHRRGPTPNIFSQTKIINAISYEEILEEIKKTDGRLRECFSTIKNRKSQDVKNDTLNLFKNGCRKGS